jgi:hypothetical protein
MSNPLEAVAAALYEAYTRSAREVQAASLPAWEALQPSQQMIWQGVAREAVELAPMLEAIGEVLNPPEVGGGFGIEQRMFNGKISVVIVCRRCGVIEGAYDPMTILEHAVKGYQYRCAPCQIRSTMPGPGRA